MLWACIRNQQIRAASPQMPLQVCKWRHALLRHYAVLHASVEHARAQKAGKAGSLCLAQLLAICVLDSAHMATACYSC